MKVFYLAPKPHPLNGISQYASLLMSAIKKYAPHIAFHRLDEQEFMQCYADLPKGSVVMAEMSVGEGKVFQALWQQKRHRPDLRRVITIHDPPRFAVEMTPLLERMSATTLMRALRRAFLDTLGWVVERQVTMPHDIFLCLTQLGKQVLEQKFRQYFPFVPKVFYVPHLLYLDPPECVPEPESLVPTLGYFGYINPHKGLHILIEAVRRLKAERKSCPQLIIYGEPITLKGCRYYARLRAQVAKYRLEEIVQLRGYLPEHQIAAFLRTVDVLAMPYLDLGFVSASGVLQWARSVGVPVLASQTPALRALIADGVEGKLIPTYNIAKWAEAIHSVATERKMWWAFRSGVVHRRTEAEWKTVAMKLSAILQEIQGA
ncbi:MAG: glycosyltransferase [Chloroherpetonaceae bacterium]|nr:glycosyltransferase [Chloroherpetonaceae bacterium]MCS7210025.1 glycosyltransferase [Chloroherpetonaceae bacterium]MDW8019342.1 glycosyltransferase [Chloroherpetonaceae bacterium]MDW8465464.1 glycosyltransferase [Chloroherpetonaceae bacterium]